MGKYLYKSLVFTIFASAMYLFLLFIWGSVAPSSYLPNLTYKLGGYGHTYSRLKEVRQKSDLDILFLGSSHAYRGFDTRIFESAGYSCFNLGSSAQTPLQTRVLLERYLDRLNPRMVVYEVYPSTFTSDGVESSIDIISNDRNDWLSIQMAIRVQHLKTLNTLMYALMRDLFNMNSDYDEPVKKGNDIYIPGGFVEKKMKFYRYSEYLKRKWEINEEQLTALNDILRMLRERNIDLLLVNAPITPSLYRSYSNNEVFDRMMSEHGRYYNFNEIIELDDSLHFYDSHHLNQSGVQIFNEKLLEILARS